jgi:hypothetical protein
MSIERTYYCEGPDCPEEEGQNPAHVVTATPPPYIPGGFIETRMMWAGQDEERHHFCSWPCLMKYAADQPIPERIDV